MGHSYIYIWMSIYIYIQYLFFYLHINCLCSIAMFDFKRVTWISWDQCHSVMLYTDIHIFKQKSIIADNVVGSNSPWNLLRQIWHQPTKVGISPCSKTDAVWSIPSSPSPRAFGSQPRPNSRGLFSGPSPPWPGCVAGHRTTGAARAARAGVGFVKRSPGWSWRPLSILVVSNLTVVWTGKEQHLLIPWSHDPNVSVFAKAEETRDCFLMYTLKWWMTLALNESWNSGNMYMVTVYNWYHFVSTSSRSSCWFYVHLCEDTII